MKKKIRSARKNFLPTLLVTLVLWGTIAGVVFFVSPEVSGAPFVLFLLLFLALLFTFSLALANSRRGFLAAITITTFLIFRYFGIGNLLNLLLLAGLALAIETYFHKN